MAYSDGEVAEALVRLAINKYNFQLTHEQTDIPLSTLKRWAKKEPKKSVADLLDRAIQRMLMVIPKDIKGRDWAIALGILLDKWLLIQGEPTERTESLIRGIDEMTEEEKDAVVERARTLVRAIGEGGTDIGDK